MSNAKKPRKLPKAERIARTLHQKIAHARALPSAADREKHLRKLMGLPATPPRQQTNQGRNQ
jgi:hypothetical protein